MDVLKTLEDLAQWKKANPKSSDPLARGFVPTMGALHKGHLALIEKCRQKSEKTLVSIFVNPIQFNNLDDFSNYPITLEKDLSICEKAGVDAVFCPGAKEMYPEGFSSFCEVKNLDQHLCGATRPGHFRGVCTVVLKLFNLLQPSHSYFGQKDFQQARIIERLVADLNLSIHIFVEPIVREADGLAMSSRNKRLSSKERQIAPQIFKGLTAAQKLFLEGFRNAAQLESQARHIIEKEPLFSLDYLNLVYQKNLEPAPEVNEPCLLAVACNLGDVRLIDNILLNPTESVQKQNS